MRRFTVRVSGTALLIYLMLAALLAVPGVAQTQEVTLVSAGSVWYFDDTGTDLGTTWRGLGFDDSSWSSGPAELGFGDRDEATVTAKSGFTTYFRHGFIVADASQVTALDLEMVRDDGAVVYLNGTEVFRSNMPGGAITYSTKASSDVSGAAEGQWYQGSVDESLLADGVNVLAVEVHDRKTKNKDLSFDLRLIGQSGEPTPDTEAPSVSIDITSGSTITGDPAILFGTASDNVAVSTASIAVQDVATGEWLQSDGSWASSQQYLPASLSNPGEVLTSWSYSIGLPDGGYALSVDAVDSSSNHGTVASHPFTVETAVPPPVVTLIAAASNWSYDDSGSDLGTTWRGVAFDDSSWSSGPAELGFGDRSEATVTDNSGFTTYFRHDFTVGNASLVTGLDVEVIRDDGAVVYLNGVEVFRTNMPGGVITYATKASSDVSGAGESQWFPASIDERLLVDGLNTVAVEVHDRKNKNKDLSFDLRLTGETGAPDPAGPAVGPRAITCPIGALDIQPGQSIAAAVAANAPGTTFCLKPGTYLDQSVQPKDGQTFLGEVGAILNGNDSTAHAFSGNASRVTIENLVIENYSTIAQFGAVNGEGNDWRVVHNDVRNNAGVGVFVDGNRASIQSNFIHQNHQLGISLTFSADSVVEDNEISYNNWLGEYEWGWEAGGTKFWTTTNLIVRGNESHDNLGPGLWSDTDNIGILYENNVVHENRDAPGIFHEIGYDAIIRNNHIWDNGWPDTMPSNPYWQRGAIQIAGSSNVEVHGNLIEDSAKGIVGIDQCRGTGLHGLWALLNVWAHDNTIDNSNLSTAESDCGSTVDFVFENNTLLGNSYIE